MKRLAFVLVLGACGGEEESADPPLAEVAAPLEKLAVNDMSIFAIDTTDKKILELDLATGMMVGKLPSNGAVSELVAHGAWVAWIEAEGNGKLVQRRKANGTVESFRATTTSPKIVATAEGLFFSDGTLVAVWMEGTNPDRIATTGSASSKVIGVDSSYVYATESDTSVVKYNRQDMAMMEVVLPMSKDAVVKDGQIAHRTAEGVRMRDLLTGFDRVVGAPPADYPCELLIAGRAVICGKYRAWNGVANEFLDDKVSGYASVGSNVVWVKSDDGKSTIYRVNAESIEE
jgi:hypothetical protein